MAGNDTDYRVWREIEYRPAMPSPLPLSLTELLRADSRVLEIGCNEGAAALFMAEAGFAVVGVDLNPRAVAVATGRARKGGLGGRVLFRVADALSEEVPTGMDAVVMIRTLTCLPAEEDWVRMLDVARASLREGGFLYVSDFLRSPAYEARYRDGAGRGWREGAFLVPAREGQEAFVAYHHDERDLARLEGIFHPCLVRRMEGLSLNGNPVRMFEYVGTRS